MSTENDSETLMRTVKLVAVEAANFELTFTVVEIVFVLIYRVCFI